MINIMKKLLFILILAVINITGILLLLPESPFNVEKQTIYIAVAGPMSGSNREDGEAMLRGVEMYLDKIKENGRFKDKKIELLVYNDKNKRTAISIASQIADEGKTLLVIGHYESPGSVVAGTIYRKNGIPAITASATSEKVTQENEWYFRVIPDNRFIRSFIAYSIRKLLNSTSVSIISDEDDYGASLSLGFESEARKLGIDIRNKWTFDSESDNLNHELQNIIGELRAVKRPGTIFCASHAAEGVRFFASSRYPGTAYTVVGPDSFSTPAFISQFNTYPREQESPGYYTDGIYAVSPFISYLADKEDARRFRDEFVRKYDQEPSWVAACYYDAMNVTLSAIERAEIRGKDIREDRQKLKKALASFNEPVVAVRGITGDIYFDKHGNVTRPLAIGFWNKQIFLPFYLQYQAPVPEKTPEPVEDASLTTDKKTGEEIIMIGGQAMTRLSLVYAGVDFNAVRSMDMEKGRFTADFYLWFRFYGDFDDTRISFSNALSPVALGEPILEETHAGITTRTYRVIADFKTDYDPADYPLDRHTLSVHFRHEDRTITEITYVPDVPGLSHIIGSSDKGKMMVNAIPGWDVRDISSHQDIMKIPGPDKQTRSYSRFNTMIHIQREGRILLLLKRLFPMIVAVILLYFVFQIPPDLPGIRKWIIVPVLLIICGLHLWHGYDIFGRGGIGYAFLTVYILIGLTTLISAMPFIMQIHNDAGKIRTIRRINALGKILYLFILLGGVYMTYLYSSDIF